MLRRRGSSRNPSSSVKANPTTLAPWVSTQLVSIPPSTPVSTQCRSRTSIIASTSEDEPLLSWE
jgi:hypothetical protein